MTARTLRQQRKRAVSFRHRADRAGAEAKEHPMGMELQPVKDSALPDRINSHLPALREAGKIDRMNFMAAVKAFTEYVDDEGEGSARPDLAYANFTRSVYAAFGLNKVQREALMSGERPSRDLFDVTELRYLQMAESTAAAVIWEGIAARVTRKAIKTAVKEECGKIAAAHRRISGGIFKGAQHG